MAARARRLPAYSPDFSDVAGWAINYIKRNYWRVVGIHEFEDLVQEARFQFWRLCVKYPHVRHKPHMVRLFQRTFAGRLHDLASEATKYRRHLPINWNAEEVREDRYAVSEPMEGVEGSLGAQEVALLINEFDGDLFRIGQALGIQRSRIKHYLNRLNPELRKSLLRATTNRVYVR